MRAQEQSKTLDPMSTVTKGWGPEPQKAPRLNLFIKLIQPRDQTLCHSNPLSPALPAKTQALVSYCQTCTLQLALIWNLFRKKSPSPVVCLVVLVQFQIPVHTCSQSPFQGTPPATRSRTYCHSRSTASRFSITA